MDVPCLLFKVIRVNCTSSAVTGSPLKIVLWDQRVKVTDFLSSATSISLAKSPYCENGSSRLATARGSKIRGFEGKGASPLESERIHFVKAADIMQHQRAALYGLGRSIVKTREIFRIFHFSVQRNTMRCKRKRCV